MEVQQCACGEYVKWAPGAMAPPCSSCGAYLRGQARPTGRLLGTPKPAAPTDLAEGPVSALPLSQSPLAPTGRRPSGPDSVIVDDGLQAPRVASPLARLDPYAPVASRWKREIDLESNLFAIAAGISLTACLQLATALLILVVAPPAWQLAAILALFAGIGLLSAQGLRWLRPVALVGAILTLLPAAFVAIYLGLTRAPRTGRRRIGWLLVSLAPCFSLWQLASAASLFTAEYRQFMVEADWPRPAHNWNRYFWIVLFAQGLPAVLLGIAVLFLPPL